MLPPPITSALACGGGAAVNRMHRDGDRLHQRDCAVRQRGGGRDGTVGMDEDTLGKPAVHSRTVEVVGDRPAQVIPAAAAVGAAPAG